jgi:hypothetical protein
MPDGAGLSIEVWNEMGGDLQWSALPVLCAIHGIEDVESLISQLVAIRNVQVRKHGGQ